MKLRALIETARAIAQTLEMRRAYRELLLTTPGLGECICLPVGWAVRRVGH